MTVFWSKEEAEYVVTNWLAMDDATMGEHLGRSRRSVKAWRQAAGLKREKRGRYSILQGKWARAQAAMAGGRGQSIRPPRIKLECTLTGFTPETVIWARMNRENPEARMILAMMADPAAAGVQP